MFEHFAGPDQIAFQGKAKMANDNVSRSVPPPPNEPLFTPEELEALAAIVRNRHRGFIPTSAETDILIELVTRHMGGSR